MSLVKVAICRADDNTIRLGEIENELKALQEFVGGYIQYVPITPRIGFICNEEGKLMDLKPNFEFRGDLVVGNVLFVALEQGDIVSLTDEDLEVLEEIVSTF